MIETCTTKKMLILIGILLTASLTILLLEEYVEETGYDTAKIIDRISLGRKGNLGKPDKSKGKTGSLDCSDPGTLKLLNSCIPCSDFELNAMKTQYCRETGFYDKFRCTVTNESVYKPCYSKSTPPKTKFSYFVLVMLFSSTGFTYFVFWRKAIVDRRAYTRLQNFLG
ncbi:hypothetical protein FO519_002642 [Halicephalobus sp. NKZ332]|nr:hypothetical protein FO519_002642 [Halicephalobus sp. NKZ332]